MNTRSSNDQTGQGKPEHADDIRDQLRDLREHIFPSSALGDTFFEHSIYPGFVLHILSGVFINVNEAFETLFNYDREDLLSGGARARQLIHHEDQPLMKMARRAPDKIPKAEYDAYGRDCEGNSFPIRLAISSCTVQGHHLLYGLCREVSSQKKREETLRKQLNEVVQANNRILALTEKVRQVPDLMSELMNLDCETDKEFFRIATSKLCERSGLNYQNVTFFLLDEEEGALTSPLPDETDSDPIPASSNEPVADVLAENTSLKRPEEDVFVLLLPGEKQTIGALRIQLNSEERRLLEGNPSVWSGFRETLVTLSNILGLILQNRRLHES